MRIARWLGVWVSAVVGALLAFTALAWACVPVALFNASPNEVRPGQEVTLTGKFFNANPVTIHFDSLDGPVLATLTPPRESGALLQGTVLIPEDTKPGSYVLIATQEPQEGRRPSFGVPARTLVQVVGEGGQPVLGAPVGTVESGRPATLLRQDGVSAASLALVAVGVAGVGMFAAGVIAFATGRSRRQPETASRT